MLINLDSYFGVHDDALLLFDARNRILASNIANADTPGYKARDLDFDAVLQKASPQQVTLAGSNPKHIQFIGEGLNAHLRFRRPLQDSLDGNTVDSQREKAAFAENNIRYQASLTFLSKKISGLISAFKGE